jgi:hypothetical protein
MNLLNERKEALEQQIDAEVKNSLSERANKYDFLNILSSHLWELNKIIFLVDGLVKENILDKSLFQKDKNSMQEIEKMQGM